MTDAWKDNHCWVSAPPSLVRDRFLLLATFLQRQIKISANQIKGERKFFSYLIVIASRHYFATSDFSQSHERNGKCFPAHDKKARFCSFSFPQYLPWTPGEAWANHVKAVNCAMKAISCFSHSSLTQRKVIFLPFVNLDIIFSFFGSSCSTTKVEMLLSVFIPAGKTLFCLYRKQSDCDIDLFVSLNAMQAW